MAKKLKNSKLLVQKQAKQVNRGSNKILSSGSENTNKKDSDNNNKSVFSAYSNRLQIAKQRKLQKLNQTKNRLLNKKKQNKIIRMKSSAINTGGARLGNRNKINKFSLIDQGQDNMTSNRLTHKGQNLSDLKNFNDMHFDNNEDYDMQDNSADFGQANFHGFDEQDPNGNPSQPQRPKSKNQIYKQIIQKSKKHKHQRQQQYEQNLQKAIQLDDQFQQFVSNLKFRTQEGKVQQKILQKKKDSQYEKLMNELKDDERIVANRVVDNNRKGQEKIRKKKNIQLKQLMVDSQGQEGGNGADIRGWVKGLNEDSQSQLQDHEDSNQDGDEESQQNQDQNHSQNQDEQQDQIDQVALSSGDQEQQNQDQIQDQEQIESDKKIKRPIIVQQQSSELQEQQSQNAQKQQSNQSDDLSDQEYESEQQEEINPRNKKLKQTNSKAHKKINKNKKRETQRYKSIKNNQSINKNLNSKKTGGRNNKK